MTQTIAEQIAESQSFDRANSEATEIEQDWTEEGETFFRFADESMLSVSGPVWTIHVVADDPPITIKLNAWGDNGRVYLDPEDRTVEAHCWVGTPTTPMAAYHGRMMALVDIEKDHVEESITEWLESQRDTIAVIADGYQGSEWDGSNHSGTWTDEAHELAQQLSYDYEQAVTDGVIDQYWDAGTWLGGDWEAAMSELLEHDTVAEAAAYITDTALADGAHLDVDEVESELRSYAQKCADDLEDDDELDDASTERLTAFREMLARS